MATSYESDGLQAYSPKLERLWIYNNKFKSWIWELIKVRGVIMIGMKEEKKDSIELVERIDNKIICLVRMKIRVELIVNK